MVNSVTMLVFLTLLSVAYVTAASSLERLRLAVSHRRVASMLGVFTFAAVILLPVHLLVGFVPLVYLAAWPSFRRAGQKAAKWAYSAGAATVGCLVSSEMLHTVPGMLSLPCAIVAFMVVNLAIVAVPIAVEHDDATLSMLAKPRTHSGVLIGQMLGAAVGVAMLWNPAAALLALPLLRMLHKRATRAAVAETASCIDNVWSQEAWMALAEEAHRARRQFAIVVVDIENRDSTVVVADMLTGYLEPGDALGRLGSQLVIMLDEGIASGTRRLARLISAELRVLGVSAGVGSADCQRASVQQMLVLAAGDAIVQGASEPRSVETP